MSTFDPYRKWLGILPKDQPPNHYRLLSVELFETDADVIEGAADRQMAFVRQYQSGENAADAARILNELATARLCLLKPESKSAYDAKLRKQLKPSNDSANGAEFDFEPQARPSKKTGRSRASKSGLSTSTMIAVSIATGVVFVAIVVSLNRPIRPEGKSLQAANQGKPQSAVESNGRREDDKPEVAAASNSQTGQSTPQNVAEQSASSSGLSPGPGTELTSPELTSDDQRLQILEARFGAINSWVDLTQRLQSAVQSNRLTGVVNIGLIGSDPAFGAVKMLQLRYRCNGVELEQWFSEHSVIQLDSSIATSKTQKQGLVIHRAEFGGGILGESPWNDVTDRLISKIKGGRISCPVRDVIADISPANVYGTKSLAVQYSLDGEMQTTAFDEQETIDIGPESQTPKRAPSSDRSQLQILMARYGNASNWVDFTERADRAARRGYLLIKVDNLMVGHDPVPYASKRVEIRYRINDVTSEVHYAEHALIYFGKVMSAPVESSNKLQIIDAQWGLGILGEETWDNVTDRVKSHVDHDSIDVSYEALIENLLNPIPGVKILCVRYAERGQVRTTFIGDGRRLILGK